METLSLNPWSDLSLVIIHSFGFDIVFKSGEFYGDEGSFLQNFIIAIVGAAIGAYVTFRVFRETLKNDREKEARKRTQEQEKEVMAKNDLENQRLIYFHYLVRNSLSFTISYIANLNEFIADYERNKTKIPILIRNPSNDLQRVTNDIDRELHFHGYMNHIPEQGIFKLYGILDFIENVRLGIDKDIDRAKRIESKHKDEFRQGVQKIISLSVKYMENYEYTKAGFSSVFETIDEVSTNLKGILENNNSDYQAIIEKVARPLIKEYIDNGNEDQSPYFKELVDVASRLTHLYKILETVSGKVATSINNYLRELSSQLVILKKEFSVLDGYIASLSSSV